jgi:hypothetical protein
MNTSTQGTFMPSSSLAAPASAPRQHVQCYALPFLLLLLSGCATATIVESRVEPRHFQFVTVTAKRGKGAGGWRAACLHLHIGRAAGESIVCKFGIEMPMETELAGPISTPLAQRIAADCANQAALIVFSPSTPETPLGLLCEGFKNTYDTIIHSALKGAQITKICHKKTKPVEFGAEP